MVTVFEVRPDEDPTFSTALITSKPSTTCPKTTCFPSSQDVFSVHMKNWDPLVLGPALAMDRIPGPVCFFTNSVSGSEVTALAHELRDNAVKGRALEVKRLPGLADALLASAERAEVLRRARSRVGVELHDDSTARATADRDIEKNARIGRHLCRSIRGNSEKRLAVSKNLATPSPRIGGKDSCFSASPGGKYKKKEDKKLSNATIREEQMGSSDTARREKSFQRRTFLCSLIIADLASA
ncbi:hypothetical protein IEQ34_008222 [Dendrobium chrysotoxum]|uniref:Uncharacterized protein n=1 Tax=Dendrobium chrysotoxum TaxID=161865 RepID=A0AAV7H832_DENCH|nr:hypothetical protein IEQ34_008222 [Dendrobium chrysotoxum]